jgi:hypothetical protein
MLQGDDEWVRLVDVINDEDAPWRALHNAHARPAGRLYPAPGAVPFIGAVMTAPVVLLLTHPEVDGDTTPHDYRYSRDGWPLSALHPDAPSGLSRRFDRRLAALVRRFGAQHVAHSVAAVFANPWPSVDFDARLELPSLRRMQGIVSRAAERDAAFVLAQGAGVWLEHRAVADLPATRRLPMPGDGAAEIDAATIGAEAWERICARIEVHAWL